MTFDVLRILGVALLVLGAQGAIRLLADHADTGLPARLPGGFPAVPAGHLAAVAAGVLLAWWGQARAKRTSGR